MTIQANIYLFKVNHRNTKKRCEICSKLAIKDIEDIEDIWTATLLKKRLWHRSFTANFTKSHLMEIRVI